MALTGLNLLTGRFFKTAAPVFNTGFENISQEQLMQYFRSENWPNDLGLRNDLLQEVSNRISAERGCDQVRVSLFYQDNNNMGGFTPRGASGYIELNEKYLNNPYAALDTIAHETNHHVQNVSDKLGGHGYSEHERAIIRAENANSGYGTYDEDSSYYFMQDLELDSNNYAYDYVTRNSDQFKDDPRYQDYLSERAEYFDTRANEFENDKQGWNDRECEHVDRALRSGEIDSATAAEAKEAIQTDDPFKQEMLANREKSHDLNSRSDEYRTDQNTDEHQTDDIAQTSENASLKNPYEYYDQNMLFDYDFLSNYSYTTLDMEKTRGGGYSHTNLHSLDEEMRDINIQYNEQLKGCSDYEQAVGNEYARLGEANALLENGYDMNINDLRDDYSFYKENGYVPDRAKNEDEQLDQRAQYNLDDNDQTISESDESKVDEASEMRDEDVIDPKESESEALDKEDEYDAEVIDAESGNEIQNDADEDMLIGEDESDVEDVNESIKADDELIDSDSDLQNDDIQLSDEELDSDLISNDTEENAKNDDSYVSEKDDELIKNDTDSDESLDGNVNNDESDIDVNENDYTI